MVLLPPRTISAAKIVPAANSEASASSPPARLKTKRFGWCVESAEHRKNAFENLLSERGALLRMNRSIQVEGAFGVLKSNRKFKRFLMRGKTNISTELFLLCLAFDLQKFFSKLQRGKRKSHLFPLKKE